MMFNLQSRYYSWALLFVLSIAYLCATLDRVVISLLVDPIKADLNLTDTEISLLLGLAFVLVFSVSGLFMGVLVDRVRRTRLLGAGVGAWSFMTGLCGLSNSFLMLFLARAGVGIGEATLIPAGYSLISDAFDQRRLGLALGIFTTGGAIGTGLSLVLGGFAIGVLSQHGDYHVPVLGTLHPWQMVFILLAIPGFVVAGIVAVMPEPMRKSRVAVKGDPGATGAVGLFYRNNKALLSLHHIATGLSSMVLLGGYSWIAPLLTRVHGWEVETVGYAVGLVSIVGAPIGLLGGGALGDRLLERGPHLRLVICAISVAIAAIAGLAYPLLGDSRLVVLSFGAMVMFATVPVGVGNAALQHVVPGEIRGRVSAIYYLCMSAVGMLGPTLVAGTSDIFFPFSTGIAYAIAVVIPSGLILATLLWLTTIPLYRRMMDSQ